MDERPLSPEAKAARNAYQRRWRHEHPDRCREYARRHWEAVAQRARKEAGEGDR